MEPNAYECPACGTEIAAADHAVCPNCAASLVLEPDAETVVVGESVKVRDHTRWVILKEAP